MDRAQPRQVPALAQRDRRADRAAVAHDERRERLLPDVAQAGLNALGVLPERLAAWEAELGAAADVRLPLVGEIARDVGDEQPLPVAPVDLVEALVAPRLEAHGGADDSRGLPPPTQRAPVERDRADPAHALGERAGLLAPAIVQGRVRAPLDP